MRGLTPGFSIGLRGLATLLLNGRARRALRGLMMLRRVYEYVLLMATIEGMQPVPRPHYQGYVDALNVVAAKANLIASTL
jgi:hypothetical protein